MMYEDESEYNDLASASSQQRLLATILELSNGGEAPSVGEMTSAMGASADSNTVRLLDRLEEKGYIDRYRVASRVQPRGTSLTERALRWLSLNGHDTSSYRPKPLTDDQVRVVPLYGPIPAGNPAVSDDQRVIGHILMPSQYIPSTGKVYMLGVIGNSMTGDDGILNGDQLIVVPYVDLKGNGEIVVATVDGEETVKRLWRDGDQWRLQPSNPEFDDIPLGDGDRVTGLVVGLVRWNIKPARLR